MYILDKQTEKNIIKRYFAIILFTTVFGIIYETQSHGVFSWHMGFLFIGPLVGTLPYLIDCKMGKIRIGIWTRRLWNSAVAAYTTGSMVQGILEIYGTTSPYTKVYDILALVMAVLAVIGNYLIRTKQ